MEVRTPTRLDDEQERLLRELADLRNEDVAVAPRVSGLFGKVRDAFSAAEDGGHPPLFLVDDLPPRRHLLTGDEGRHAAQGAPAARRRARCSSPTDTARC